MREDEMRLDELEKRWDNMKIEEIRYHEIRLIGEDMWQLVMRGNDMLGNKSSGKGEKSMISDLKNIRIHAD